MNPFCRFFILLLAAAGLIALTLSTSAAAQNRCDLLEVDGRKVQVLREAIMENASYLKSVGGLHIVDPKFCEHVRAILALRSEQISIIEDDKDRYNRSDADLEKLKGNVRHRTQQAERCALDKE